MSVAPPAIKSLAFGALVFGLASCTADVGGLIMPPGIDTPVPPPPPPEPVCAVRWINLDDRPAPDALAASMFDPVRRRMVIFGAASNEVWAFNVGTEPAGFRRLEVTGTPPRPSRGASAIYDPSGDRAIVFGGFADGAAINELWSLSFADPPRWEKIEASGDLPAPRWLHSAVYDAAKKRMIVYGGEEVSRAQFVHVLSLETLSWRRISVTGVGPGNRSTQAAIWDAQRSRMILYGGLLDQVSSVFDIWSLALEPSPRWTLLNAGTGSGQGLHSPVAVYDEPRDRIAIFGELRLHWNEPDGNTEALSFSLGDHSFTPVVIEGADRGRQLVATDAASSRVIAYGGMKGADNFDDVWTWPLDQGDPPSRTILVDGGKVPLGTTTEYALQYDRARDQLWLFTMPGEGVVWTRPAQENTRWEKVDIGEFRVGFRQAAESVFDQDGDRLLFFPSGGLEAFDLSTRTWSSLTVLDVPANLQRGFGAAYDPVRDRLWFEYVGGFAFLGLHEDPARWNQVSDFPFRGALHFDASRDRLYLLGRTDLYELASEFQTIAGGVPEGATISILAPERDALLAFELGEGRREDVSEFSLADRAWRRIAATGNTPATFNARAAWTPRGAAIFGNSMSTYLVEVSEACD